MFSVKISSQGWKSAAKGLAVLMVIVVQVLGLEVGWPQESASLRTDEEIAKQEKIYGSRAATFPAATSPTERSRTTWKFFPTVSAMRSRV